MAQLVCFLIMRIVQLTPGTGDFYCGSCLRDHALIKALRELGHDAIMAPMYLPHMTEGKNAEETPIFFGGINVFLQQKFGLFRHTPRWIDRLFDGRRLLRASASKAVKTKPSQVAEMCLSMLQGEHGKQLKELERLIHWLETEARPDIVVLSNCMLIGIARRIKERLGVPVVSTLQGEDTFLDDLPEPWKSQCWSELRIRARELDGLVAVSHYYGRQMQARLGCPVDVIPNGIELDGIAVRNGPWPDPPVIGYLARMCYVKGLSHLVDAFIDMQHPSTRMHIAGACTASDEKFVDEQKGKLKAAGLAERVEWLPNVEKETKFKFLRNISLLCTPAMYGESFGLYLIEAMACGTPVLQPRHAAFPEIIENSGGGILCEFEELVPALTDVLTDPERLQQLGRAGRRGVEQHYDIRQVARQFAELYAALLSSD